MAAASMRVIPGTPDLVEFLAARFSPEQLAVVQQNGGDAMLREMEGNVRDAALSWCGVDGGGPVFLIGAGLLADGTGAGLFFVTTTAVKHHMRDCIRLWRRAAVETLAHFGAFQADVPPYVSAVRRMQRYGFTVFQPADDGGGTTVCRCRIVAPAAPILEITDGR